MFSPLNDPEVTDWFQRLNAPLKRLPAEERTQLHQEVRQHLEALAAANEELGSSPEEARQLALVQFGDPGKFGKKIAQEWRQGKTGFRADAAAIVFVVSCRTLLLIAFTVSLDVWSWLYGHHNQPLAGIISMLYYLLSLGWEAPQFSTRLLGVTILFRLSKVPSTAICCSQYATWLGSLKCLLFNICLDSCFRRCSLVMLYYGSLLG